MGRISTTGASYGPGDLVANRFRVERLAGEGGMGVVYRARDEARGHAAVALKVLTRTREAERFEQEARVLAELRHPSIVRYIAHGRTPDGGYFLAMEWLEGRDVAETLAQQTLTVAEAVELAVRVAEALGAAHERGIVHRDVKPSNLFLVGGDLRAVKVLDFGIARVAGVRSATRTGVLLGTPGYIAPEQAKGEKSLDGRADVFSLGCVLFEALAGQRPFDAPDAVGVLAKILLEPAPRLRKLRPDVGPRLEALVDRMLAKEPAGRPVDGNEVARALRSLEGTDEVPQAAGAAPERPAELSQAEQQLMSVILAGGDGAISTTGDASADVEEAVTLTRPPSTGVGSSGAGLPATMVQAGSAAALPSTVNLVDGATLSEPPPSGVIGQPVEERLRAALRTFGAEAVQLLDGSRVVTIGAAGPSCAHATDQATQAARCALELRGVLPGARIALATGRGMVAGRWPVGEVIDRAAALLHGAPPPPADAQNAPLPIRIDDVTVGLLDARFDVGGDAAGLILRGERDAIGAGRTLLGRPTPCVGRERELGVLAGLLDECLAEPKARAVLVVAPAGMGKSRLRYEFLRAVQARPEPAEIWVARGDPLGAGSPFGMLGAALRSAAGILEGEPIEVRRRKLAARVARHVPPHAARRVTEFVGELLGTPFDDEGSVELRAARADARLLGDQMRRAFEELLAAEMDAGPPLLLVLEDLHWGDLPSVRFVDSALRTLAERPFFVLALARPEVRELFPGLWAERALEELRLGELSRKGAERLVRTVLGDRADDALVARLLERAAGNAFHLEELIRAVAEGKGGGDGTEIPETLLAVLASRLERLETDARRVLRAGSVFGRVFWRGGVLALLQGSARSHRFDAWLDELVEREVISRREVAKFEGEEEFAFRHALVREAAYALLTDDDRQLGHRLAGEWLERAGESEAVVLAEHYERGGERASAIGWYRRAAEQALGGSDLPGAIERARRGVACGAEGEALGALLRIQAEAHSWRGELAEAVQCALEALTVLQARSPGWFGAAEALAFSAGKLGSVAILVKLGEQLAAAGEAALSAPEASACANTAFQLFYSGQYALAAGLLAMIERADPAVRRRDPVVLARIHQARSSRAMFAGDVGAYLDEEQQAAVAFEEAGDFRNSIMQRGHVAYACQVMGDYEAAERILREVIVAGEKLGLTSVVATAKHNLGLVLAQCGSVGAGLRMEREALAASHAQGDRRLEAGAREYLARILLMSGEPGEAEAEARQAFELVTPSFKPLVRAVVAQTLLAQARLEEALAEAALAGRELDEIGEIEEGESVVRLTHAEALLALPPSPERRGEAARVVGLARDRLLSQAANISDFRRRAGFLEQVPENARLLQLARELGI